MTWKVELLDSTVESELDALPVDLKAGFRRIVELIERFGREALREPYVKSLGKGLFEIRMRGRDGIGRAIYVRAKGEHLVVVLVFVKKTQKTPQAAVELALKRAKKVQR